ncbi:dicarboxylate/amino acid:cation symporter [Simiduia agarivorans]|uniref:Proton/sodium-glutamate symport protein n=1 Tax=Simiduia agarivorans (strain DSM 21679 / JCM 13881 / BCRC 17597 / SA1) TaxID=1117647 RepID=K4KNB4_SIMAS|nr:dicarboxylate/amino acid:cation symporter [Simiduia agarivorans]AFU99695.1 proton/sodium-glutamate symport protein [Simiduia agarivorans SA1 = DSM 21679]
MSLTSRILVAMALGLVVGGLFNFAENQGWTAGVFDAWIDEFIVSGVFDLGGKIFVALLKLLVVPLVFVSLVCGTASLGDNTRMGPMAGKTLVLYMITTAVAISLALLAGWVIKPGVGFDLTSDATYTAAAAPSLKEVILGIVPTNPVQAMAEGNMLQIILFALLVGVAMSRAGDAGKRLAAFFNDFNDIVLRMVVMLMNFAPYGVFCLIAQMATDLGLDAFANLAAYFFTVLFVLFLHGLGTYAVALKLLTGLSPIMFYRKMKSVMLFAFSMSSSNATIPVTLRAVRDELGADNRVASFTIPMGATINMDGTAIMQGVATAFIAQAYNIDIGFGGYMMVILTATLASIGTAGVPGVGLIMLAMVLEQVGLPVEGIALIIGVDRLLDMTRTAVNVCGDAMVTLAVAKSEGMLDEVRYKEDPSLPGHIG